MPILNELITWMDVARVFATIEPVSANWTDRPIGLVRARVDWAGISLQFREKAATKEEIATWLEKLFPRRIKSRNDLRMVLDGPEGSQEIGIEVEVLDTDEIAYRFPLGSVDSIIDFDLNLKQAPRRVLPIMAFHSVKGGTGRTTMAIALSGHWATRTGKPVLLVDADVEAPGISYLFQRSKEQPRISLEDIIVLAHSDTSEGYKNTIDYVSGRLADHRFGEHIFVLPLRRNLAELASSSIRAEHLSYADDPFVLSRLLRGVANSLGCGSVCIDLRAGLVPIASQFMLDPTVDRVITTSLSGQSLDATASLITFVAREMRRAQVSFPAPLIVVNRVPTVLRETGADEAILAPMLARITEDILRDRSQAVGADEPILDQEIDLSPVWVAKVPEISDLQVLSSGWEGVVEQLKSAGLVQRVSGEFDSWLNQEGSGRHIRKAPRRTPVVPTDRLQARNRLRDFAARLVAAETSDEPIEKPLITGALKSLAEQFMSELPIVISEGAKGTGKTLTARFLVSKKNWTSAVESLNGYPDGIDAHIVPVLGSIQASPKFQSEIDARLKQVAGILGSRHSGRVDTIRSHFETLFKKGGKKASANTWLDAIGWSVGIDPGKEGSGEKLLKILRDRNERLVAVFEGLEELYADPFEGAAPELIRALIVDLPTRLRGEPGRPLGLVVFARRDSVNAAVPQNRDQFRVGYRDFALSWSDDDVLELAAWLATQSNAIAIWNASFRNLMQAEKERRLEILWGRKLGPDDKPGERTKEAYTAPWVIAALSDLQGRLVARDLIRFLENAGQFTPTEAEEDQYSKRLLVPRSLKQAIKPTSVAKVKETEEEIRELKAVFSKFKKQDASIVAPIGDDAIRKLQLSPKDVKLLQQHAIIFGQVAPYEVPELFRMGLNLKHTGARHSVINLRRKARQRLGIVG